MSTDLPLLIPVADAYSMLGEPSPGALRARIRRGRLPKSIGVRHIGRRVLLVTADVLAFVETGDEEQVAS